MHNEAPEVQHPAEMPTEFTEDSAAAAINDLLSEEEDGGIEEAKKKAPKRKPVEEEEGDEPNDDSDEEREEEEETESDEDRADDDDSESDDADEPDDADDTNLLRARVKVGDEEVTVEEAVKGYMRTKDYTQKTQAAAEERKAALAERQNLVVVRQQHAERLAELDQIVNSLAPEPDWNALREAGDDAALARAYVEHQMRQQKLAELRQELTDVQEAAMQDQHAILSERLREERTKLLDAVPEWKDEKVRKAEKAKMLAFAESLGLGEDMKALVDHRVLLLVRDAMKYRDLQAKKPNMKASTEKVTVVKPGPKQSAERKSREVTQVTRQKQRFAKTHRVDDAARLIEMIEFPD